MKLRLYRSKVWLTKKYVVDKLSPIQIADICGVSERTIYNKLEEFDLL